MDEIDEEVKSLKHLQLLSCFEEVKQEACSSDDFTPLKAREISP